MLAGIVGAQQGSGHGDAIFGARDNEVTLCPLLDKTGTKYLKRMPHPEIINLHHPTRMCLSLV